MTDFIAISPIGTLPLADPRQKVYFLLSKLKTQAPEAVPDDGQKDHFFCGLPQLMEV